MLNHDAERDDSATATQSLQIPGTSRTESLLSPPTTPTLRPRPRCLAARQADQGYDQRRQQRTTGRLAGLKTLARAAR